MKAEVSGAYEDEKCIDSCIASAEGKDHFEDVVVNGRIILKRL
jgi:hypothetical protein